MICWTATAWADRPAKLSCRAVLPLGGAIVQKAENRRREQSNTRVKLGAVSRLGVNRKFTTSTLTIIAISTCVWRSAVY
jgi:hypothetical protein